MLKAMAFYQFHGKLEINMVKKLMDTATKTGIDDANTASKRVIQKRAETTGDLIGNKITDKIPLVSKAKSQQDEGKEINTYHKNKDNKLLMT